MLSIDDIKSKYSTAEETVRVEAWDGEVKIRQLTVAQSSEVISIQNKGDVGLALVKTASFALVEPAMSVKKILALPADAFVGIREIVDAVGDLEEPKK